jgi:hypothetical protein
MILQTIWNECVRFGGHVDIQISYKILGLEVPKKAPSFALVCLECLGIKVFLVRVASQW